MRRITRSSTKSRSIIHATTSTGDIDLRKLPVEIRRMVYKLNYNDTPKGRTPTIVTALRPDAELYSEALNFFYEEAVVRMHSCKQGYGETYLLRDLSEAVLPFLKKMKVEFK